MPSETALPWILGLAALIGCGDADQGVKSVEQIYGPTGSRPASSASTSGAPSSSAATSCDLAPATARSLVLYFSFNRGQPFADAIGAPGVIDQGIFFQTNGVTPRGSTPRLLDGSRSLCAWVKPADGEADLVIASIVGPAGQRVVLGTTTASACGTIARSGLYARIGGSCATTSLQPTPNVFSLLCWSYRADTSVMAMSVDERAERVQIASPLSAWDVASASGDSVTYATYAARPGTATRSSSVLDELTIWDAPLEYLDLSALRAGGRACSARAL